MTQRDCNGIKQRDKPSPVAVATGGRTYVVGSLPLRPDAKNIVKNIATGLSRCKTEPERFQLTVEAVPGWGDVPAIIRLRRFLKAALRSYGLRCTEAREITPPVPASRPAAISEANGEMSYERLHLG